MPLLGDGLMPASLEFLLDLTQLRPRPLLDRDAFQQESSVQSLPATVRESQEVEGLRSAESPLLPALGGVPSELDQPRLLGRQLQLELREPVAELCQKPASITLVLEAHDVVVGEPHDDHIAARVLSPPLIGPQGRVAGGNLTRRPPQIRT